MANELRQEIGGGTLEGREDYGKQRIKGDSERKVRWITETDINQEVDEFGDAERNITTT